MGKISGLESDSGLTRVGLTRPTKCEATIHEQFSAWAKRAVASECGKWMASEARGERESASRRGVEALERGSTYSCPSKNK
ncbi:hypothetical protein MA16_Dca017660 [Dendrobium catenatum]|uniref:Uncharacterized protein n=1 Tax=Dendrobium catenatum TaxID=906689 RepID=A0A2I0XA92_9ASPA|nr:hypothetical protein MA16_Dca017660 [Dendrobium catenatum]